MQTFHASLLILISCYLQTSSSFIHSHQTIKNTRKLGSLWSMTSTDISKITPILVEQSNDFSSLNEVVVKKRVPIGSEPEFYIPDDSTIETSSQRLWIAAHFSLFAFNLFLFVQGALASVAIGGSSMAALVGLKLTSYAAITIISIILGDFAVSSSRAYELVSF